MCFRHDIAYFDDRNILNFKGFNGIGKSAFLKATAVCLMNVYAHKQVDFIRYNEDYFRIIVTFEDGVKILRDKYINGQSLYEMYRQNELVFSTKVGNKLTRVADVPQVIKDYLALIENGNSGTGYLNFQTRKEPLWLTETTGSDNYQSLNIILKSGEISRASALINSDKNELNSAITELENDVQQAELQLASSEEYTPELLNALENRDRNAKELSSRVNAFNEISDLVEQLQSIQPMPEVSQVDGERYRRILYIISLLLEIEKLEEIPMLDKIEIQKGFQISNIRRLSEELDNVKTSPYIEALDQGRLHDIVNIGVTLSELSEIKSTVGSNIGKVELNQLENLKRIAKCAGELHTLNKEYSSTVKDISSTAEQLEVLIGEASKQGMKFIKCNNCGSYMRVNVGGK